MTYFIEYLETDYPDFTTAAQQQATCEQCRRYEARIAELEATLPRSEPRRLLLADVRNELRSRTATGRKELGLPVIPRPTKGSQKASAGIVAIEINDSLELSNSAQRPLQAVTERILGAVRCSQLGEPLSSSRPSTSSS
ncbi:MAG: hypothetical protein M3328_09155 [Chloroflexota bacterium]|nr:hypothetical protein [Chloroflexota bacterium]